MHESITAALNSQVKARFFSSLALCDVSTEDTPNLLFAKGSQLKESLRNARARVRAEFKDHQLTQESH